MGDLDKYLDRGPTQSPGFRFCQLDVNDPEFEKGVCHALSTLRLAGTIGTTSWTTIKGMSLPTRHAMATAYYGNALYWFDPNIGEMVASESTTESGRKSSIQIFLQDLVKVYRTAFGKGRMYSQVEIVAKGPDA
ncbi:MAG: hypothetical protein ACYTJ0_04965 [Planctomycetota bacterium]|jgi:hypothetical protein